MSTLTVWLDFFAPSFLAGAAAGLMAKRTLDLEDLSAVGSELREMVDALIVRYSGNRQLVKELKMLYSTADLLNNKAERLPRLRDFDGYKFAMVDAESGEVRPMTDDEAYRAMMGYQHGDVLSIFRDWTVENGKWVRRE